MLTIGKPTAAQHYGDLRPPGRGKDLNANLLSELHVEGGTKRLQTWVCAQGGCGVKSTMPLSAVPFSLTALRLCCASI